MTEVKNEFNTIRAIQMLLGDTGLQNMLLDDEKHAAALSALNMPENTRSELLNILTRVERITEKAVANAAEKQPVLSPESFEDKRIEKMQLESFDHIRISFWVMLSMSIILFLVGMMLMIIAVTQALGESAISTSTLTIAGLGLADFVLLFFRRPWQDVSVNLSNSQQVRTITTSYLVGLALLKKGDQQSFERLNEMTSQSVLMLEQYAEEREDNKE